MNIYADYTEDLMVKSIDKIDFCQEYHLGLKWKLHEFIDELKSPDWGYTEYLGEKDVPWAEKDTKYYAFMVRLEFKGFEE